MSPAEHSCWVDRKFSGFRSENEVVVFDAEWEETLGEPENENFPAEHMQIAFGKTV